MDKTDLEILKILQKKARIPNVEVARTIGMAPSAVLERIKKLEAKGVIEGYEVRLNSDMFHCAMIAFIHIKVSPPAATAVTAQKLSLVEQVQEVHHLAGADCLMVKIRAADNAELESILKSKISCLPEISDIKTYIAISSYKESAKIMLPDSAENIPGQSTAAANGKRKR